MFPIVQHNENPELSVFGFDYSKSAVEVVKVRTAPACFPIVAETDPPTPATAVEPAVQRPADRQGALCGLGPLVRVEP